MNARRSDYKHEESELVICQGCGDISLEGMSTNGFCSFCDGMAKDVFVDDGNRSSQNPGAGR